jgi:hypothetical protein
MGKRGEEKMRRSEYLREVEGDVVVVRRLSL